MDESRLAERVELLRGGWLFADCTEDELERIAALAHTGHVTAGEVVVREGDPGDEFYVIVDGTAQVTIDDGQVVADLTPGGFFGEMALLDGGERVATVTATTDLGVLILHREEFNEVLEIAMPSLAPKLLTVVGRRVRELEARQGRGVPFGA